LVTGSRFSALLNNLPFPSAHLCIVYPPQLPLPLYFKRHFLLKSFNYRSRV
jgi:hypothetical protein